MRSERTLLGGNPKNLGVGGVHEVEEWGYERCGRLKSCYERPACQNFRFQI